MQGEMITDISCGDNFSLFLTKQKLADTNLGSSGNFVQNIYSCGLNSSG